MLVIWKYLMCLLIINEALGYWFIAYTCEVSVMLMTKGMGLPFKRMLHLILQKTNTKNHLIQLKYINVKNSLLYVNHFCLIVYLYCNQRHLMVDWIKFSIYVPIIYYMQSPREIKLNKAWCLIYLTHTYPLYKIICRDIYI